MDVRMGKLKDSGLFTEDELDALRKHQLDLDSGKVLGINGYMQDRTEENWNKSWKLVSEWYTEAQSKVDRWKIILCAIVLAKNKGENEPSKSVLDVMLMGKK